MKNFTFNIKITCLVLIIIFAFLVSAYNADDLSLHPTNAATAVGILKLMKEGTVKFIHNSYTGINFFFIPFFLLLGFTPFAFYMAQSVFLVLAVLITYIFGKEYYNERVGLLAALLLSFFSGFILMKLNEYPFMPFFTLLITFFFYKFYKNKEIRYLYIAVFISGFAIYFKIIFIYLLISLILSFLILRFGFEKKRKKDIIEWKRGNLIYVSIVIFLIGFSPAFFDPIYNPLDFASGFFSGKPDYEIRKYFEGQFSLSDRMIYTQRILSENSLTVPELTVQFDTWGSGYGNPLDNPFNSINFNFYLFSISALSLLFFRGKKDYFIILVIIFSTMFLTLTPLKSQPFHLVIIFPFYVLIIARFFEKLYNYNLSSKIIFIVLVSIFVILNFFSIYKITNALNDQEFLETKFPEVGKVNSEIGSYLTNYSKIVTAQYGHPYTQLYFSIGETKDIIQMCEIEETGVWHKPRLEANCSDVEKILDETTKDTNVGYLFPTQLRESERERAIFSAVFCDIIIGKDGCYANGEFIPFKVFKEYIGKNNKTVYLERIVNGSTGPVYKTYIVK